ncbi:MAG TPA: glycosyltransferase [Ramlibacter sp.]|nr:glycosyltransferase [Ramlibacter sp.]
MKTLVVFSHLRWNFVYQRPQHLLSRLALRWRVILIEEPVLKAERNEIERFQPTAGLEVWRPHVTGDAPGFHDDHLPVLRRLVAQALREHAVDDYWLWFYTPMALPLATELSPRGVVYDCMDELAAFKNAPRQLVQRENALFKMADLVFTGGRSIYNAKKGRHADVHCFPSSVDAEHFSEMTADHPLQAHLPRPRLGYCGVIDERINIELIDGLARARPHWQVVMVGPTAKIDPEALPKHGNIAWLGQQGYGDLPALISGWDVCLMPFALNEATRYISPTKTLEYMACGRPCVSTAIRDVVEPYGHLVDIVENTDQLVAACERILARSAQEQAAHARALAEVVAHTSWDATAQAMATLIAQADRAVDRRAVPAQAQPVSDDSAPLHLTDAAKVVSVVAPSGAEKRASAAG